MLDPTEYQVKLQRLRLWMASAKVKGLCLGSRSSFAWLLGGASNTVRQDVAGGQAWVLVTEAAVKILTNAIEAPRIKAEELGGLPLDVIVTDWRRGLAEEARAVCDASDNGDFGLPARGDELAPLREEMLPAELNRWREGGRLCGEAMEEAVERFARGMNEQAMAGELSRSLWSRGVLPAVLLVAGDERQLRFRHGIPTALPVKDHAMLVVCGNYKGLILSLTRLVSFGSAPTLLKMRQSACLKVEAAMWSASKPGAAYAEVFEAACQEYAAQGFGSEELRHHQGGSAGYEPRERLGGVHPGAMALGTPLAWNPSIQGAKSEDTVLCGDAGAHEVVTLTPHWPMKSFEFGGKSWVRPWFKEIA